MSQFVFQQIAYYTVQQGPVSIGSDGSYYLEVTWGNSVDWYQETPGEISCAEYYVESTGTTTTQLMTVSPTGSASMTPLSFSCSQAPNLQESLGIVIPDGTGGALAMPTGSNFRL
jgi:hypothetical protein